MELGRREYRRHAAARVDRAISTHGFERLSTGEQKNHMQRVLSLRHAERHGSCNRIGMLDGQRLENKDITLRTFGRD